jgi:hypothetical protein
MSSEHQLRLQLHDQRELAEFWRRRAEYWRDLWADAENRRIAEDAAKKPVHPRSDV